MELTMSTGTQKNWAVERRWPRYKVDLRLKVVLNSREGRNFTFGQGSDVSEGGMAAYIPAEIEVGEIVQIEVMLPYSTELVVVRAEVRNKNGFRYGLEYVLISPDHKELLKKSLRTLALMH
jgi:c-di-GMP-binding flagellar brake protein YcgR